MIKISEEFTKDLSNYFEGEHKNKFDEVLKPKKKVNEESYLSKGTTYMKIEADDKPILMRITEFTDEESLRYVLETLYPAYFSYLINEELLSNILSLVIAFQLTDTVCLTYSARVVGAKTVSEIYTILAYWFYWMDKNWKKIMKEVFEYSYNFQEEITNG